MACGCKTGGRQAGTPNKVTSELRGRLKGILNAQLTEIEKIDSEEWKTLSDSERINLVKMLLPYVLPKVDVFSQEPTAGSGE